MIIETDFVNHWKTRALATAVGKGEALQALLLLWGHCQTRKAWEFELTPLMLAGICSYEGEAERLWKAMLELRWILPTEELGWFQVRGWGEVNASLVGKWAGGLRKTGATWHARGYGIDPTKGATIGSTSGKPQDTTGTASGSTNGSTSASSIGPTDLIGLDRIGEERKSPPKAPKGAHTLPMPSEWSAKRVETMQRWLDYRVASGKKVKAYSWPSLQVKLAVLDDEQLRFCVEDSIANGWSGLFPDKFTLPPPTSNDTKGAKNREKKEGGGAAGVKPADFPWRDVAISCEGWTPQDEWEDQTPRTRKQLRETWGALSPQGKQAIWALSPGAEEPANAEKKEGAGPVEAVTGTPPDWREHFTRYFGPDMVIPATWADVPPAMQRQVWADLEKRKGGAGAE